MPARACLSMHWLRAKFVGQPQGLSLRYAKTKKFAKITGGDGTLPLHDFIQADVGRTRLFLLQGKSRDSLCPAAQKRAGMEPRPYMILSKPMSGGQGCFYCKVKAAIRCAPVRTKKAVPNGTAFLFILGNRDYFIASSTATAQATVIPTIGLLPAPIRPIISTCAGTEEEPANCASPCILPMESVKP